jgi:hypothetical protein
MSAMAVIRALRLEWHCFMNRIGVMVLSQGSFESRSAYIETSEEVMALRLALAMKEIVKELLPLPWVEDHKMIGVADEDSFEKSCRQQSILSCPDCSALCVGWS